MKRGKPFWRRLTAAAAFFWISSLLPAQAPPGGAIPSAVWDAAVSIPPPAWFGPVQQAATANMTIWRAPIRPPPGLARLAVTLVFEETQGGFARLIWQGSGRAVTLCGNLYEGAASLHARTLLLDRVTLGGPGQLVLEATGHRPVLVRAELSWVEPLVLAASGRTPPGLFLAPSGKLYPADEMHGQGRAILGDERRGRIVDALLDAGPVKILPTAPVRFVAPIASAPSFARLEAQLAGLHPDEEPALWINGRPLTAVSVELPSLDDVGYQWMGGGARPFFGGWRKVTAHVPGDWLQAGENRFDWQCPPGSVGMTVRQLRLQLSYERPAALPAPPLSPSPKAPVFSSAVTPVTAPGPLAVSAPKLRLGLSSAGGGLNLRAE